jgi:hypothetical protein
MRNIGNISIEFIRIRTISSLDVLLLLLGDIGFGELDDFFTICVHS